MDQKQVEYVATLARLALTPEEVTQYGVQLTQIFSYIDKLNELDTTEVAATSHLLPISNVFREDAVKISLSVEKVLENAPDQNGSFFKVPKIIE